MEQPSSTHECGVAFSPTCPVQKLALGLCFLSLFSMTLCPEEAESCCGGGEEAFISLLHPTKHLILNPFKIYLYIKEKNVCTVVILRPPQICTPNSNKPLKLLGSFIICAPAIMILLEHKNVQNIKSGLS